tara:strand:+ start:1345 stop:1752 length:408 start_codon:yes stop_codon:yes gene_type:complete
MLSSQGTTSQTEKGFIVTQTIGQQSAVGNYSSLEFNIGQGFQQSNWTRIIVEGFTPEFEVSLYPNPFIGIVNVKHNSNDDIKVKIFDTSGKLIFNNLLKITEPIQSLNLESLPSGIYLVHMQSNKLNYFTKLIKK